MQNLLKFFENSKINLYVQYSSTSVDVFEWVFLREDYNKGKQAATSMKLFCFTQNKHPLKNDEDR